MNNYIEKSDINLYICKRFTNISHDNRFFGRKFLLNKRAADIVIPERDNPGKTAKPCASPTKSAVLKSVLFSLFLNFSLKNKTTPVNIIIRLTIKGFCVNL